MCIRKIENLPNATPLKMRSSIGPSSKLITLGVGDGGALGVNIPPVQRPKKPDLGVEVPLGVSGGAKELSAVAAALNDIEEG